MEMQSFVYVIRGQLSYTRAFMAGFHLTVARPCHEFFYHFAGYNFAVVSTFMENVPS